MFNELVEDWVRGLNILRLLLVWLKYPNNSYNCLNYVLLLTLVSKYISFEIFVWTITIVVFTNKSGRWMEIEKWTETQEEAGDRGECSPIQVREDQTTPVRKLKYKYHRNLQQTQFL